MQSINVKHAEEKKHEFHEFLRTSYSGHLVHEIIQQKARTQPDAQAIYAHDGQFSYRQLEDLSTRFAAALIVRGIRAESYVPICMEKSKWVAVAMLGVLKAGAAFVMMDIAHPLERMRHMCTTINASIIITSCSQKDRAKILCTESVLIAETIEIESKSVKKVNPEVLPNNAAYIMFTSGSSGEPKGVVIEHRAFVSSAMAHSKAIELDQTSRVLQFSSFAFDVCLTEILTTLMVGGTVCIPSETDRKQNLAAAAQKLKTTYAIFTPSLARAVQVDEFSFLRTLTLAGEAIQPQDVRKWAPHLKLIGAYGPTEAAVLSAVKHFRSDSDGTDAGNIGHGVGVQCWVVDPEDDSRLSPVMTVGELVLDGGSVAREYINNREQTKKSFIGAPVWHKMHRNPEYRKLYKTGDLVQMSGLDGSLRYIGRKDNQVKVNGQRLELGEIEAQIQDAEPNIKVVVVELVSVNEGKELVAFMVTQDSAEDIGENPASIEALLLSPENFTKLDFSNLQKKLRTKLPEYMVPNFLLPLSSIPLTGSGKCDRQILRSLAENLSWSVLQKYSSEKSQDRDFAAPRTDEEILLQRLWSEVLSIPQHSISRDDNFQRMGGDSLKAIQLAGVAHRDKLSLSVSQIYGTPDLKQMARVLTRREGTAETSISRFSLLPPEHDPESVLAYATKQCDLKRLEDIEDIYPCSALQAGLIALTAKSKRSGTYNVKYEYNLPNGVDIAHFKDAWNIIAQRNPILRTRIIQLRDGTMLQVVVREDLFWEESRTPPEDDHVDWKLGQRLSRFCLFSGGESRFRLALHHAITDGWALPILLKQVAQAYEGADVKPQSFTGFIKFLSQINPESSKKFWSDRFHGIQADKFPSTSSPDLASSFLSEKNLTIPQGDTSGLYTVANRLKLAWAILLCFETQNPDVVFGSIVTGRGAHVANIAALTGPTIATVPIRLQLDAGKTIDQALRIIQDDFVATIPFEQTGLQHIKRINQETQAACAFQNLLVVQAEEEPLASLFQQCRNLAPQEVFAAYPITLVCQPRDGNVQIKATFDTAILSSEKVDNLLGELHQIFKKIVPSATESTLASLMSRSGSIWPAERQRSLPRASFHAPRTAPRGEKEQILHQLLTEILKITEAELGVDDNFFTSGLDSISAMNLVSRAKEHGLVCAVSDVFQYPTIAKLTEKVRSLQSETESSILPYSLIRHPDTLKHMLSFAAQQCQVDMSEIEDVYPCSGLQEGLIALTAKAPDMYTARFQYKLPRSIDVKRFQKAWNSVFAANPILRTRICQSPKSGMYQVVLSQPPEWNMYDLAEEEKKHSRSSIMGIGKSLMTIGLVSSKGKDDLPLFVWRIHHALYDGWSLPLLWAQAKTAYQGERLLAQPYNRFIQYLTSVEDVEQYWRSELENIEAAIFPSTTRPDYTANPNTSFEFFLSNFPTQPRAYTISVALQLAWALVLAHYTDTNDVVFGLTLNGRTTAVTGITEVTGPTIATVPVRICLKEEEDVCDAQNRIQQQSIKMIPYMHHGLQNIRKISSDAAKACDFQSHLGIQPAGMMADETLGWLTQPKSETLVSYEGFVSYALTLICHLSEDNTDIRVTVNYDSALLNKEVVKRLLQQFRGVVMQILENPKMKISEIEVISPEDIELLQCLNQKVPPGTNETLHDLVLRNSLDTPFADAICAFDGDLTYRELDEHSARLAHYLISLFEPQPERSSEVSSKYSDNGGSSCSSYLHTTEPSIAVCLEKSRWSIVAILAVLRAGFACVLLSPDSPRQRLKQLIDRTGTVTILASESCTRLFKGFGLKTIVVGEMLQLRLERRSYGILPKVSPQQAAFILFTSGSTGISKAIIMEHINLCTSICAHSSELNLSHNSRALHFASYAFDASIYEIFETLICGGCLCIPSEYARINDLKGAINDLRVNFAVLTPSTISILRPYDVPGLQTLVTAGEAITRSLVEEWKDKLTLINAYGPAEATCCSVYKIPPVMQDWTASSIGSIYGCVGWIVSPSNPNKLAAVGSVGELILEGAVVTRGYLNDPEKTASAFIERPQWLQAIRSSWGSTGTPARLYRSGDLVAYNIDGTIRYVGRKDGQVKLRGQRIDLGDVEYRIRHIWPSVVDVVVEVVRPSGEGSTPVLVAFVSDQENLASSQTENTGDFEQQYFRDPDKAFLQVAHDVEKGLLLTCPAFMVPALFIRLHNIPHTQTGKIDHRLLRETCGASLTERLQQYNQIEKSMQPPSTATEHTLHSIWASVLNIASTSFGIDDSFFRLSGDSISAMEVVGQCANAGIKLSVADIFAHKTIVELAARAQIIPTKNSFEVGAARDRAFASIFVKFENDLGYNEDMVFIEVIDASNLAAFEENREECQGQFKQQVDGSWTLVLNDNHNNITTLKISGHVKIDTSSDSEKSTQLSAIYQLITIQHRNGQSVRYLYRIKGSTTVEYAYGCSPIQDGILLSQSKYKDQYLNKWLWSVTTHDGSEVDPDRLMQAWKSVVKRHPLLRAIFVPSNQDKNPYFEQLILTESLPESCNLLPQSNISLLENLKNNGLPDIPHHHPQCRFTTQRSSMNKSVNCLLEISHAMIDGMSTELILKDLRSAYTGTLVLGSVKAYEEYTQYVALQSEEKAISYWSHYLQGTEPCIWPSTVDKDIQALAGAKSHNFRIDFSQKMHDFCFAHELTIFSVFQLAWSMVLRVFLNETNVCFAAITSGRDAPITEVDKAVGPFINMLIIRQDFNSDEGILDKLQQMQVDFVSSLTHQYLSLSKKIQCTGASDNNIFNTVMSIMKETKDRKLVEDLVFEELGGGNPTEYDLIVNVELATKDINISLEYQQSHFSEQQILLIADTLQQALYGIISQPKQTVSQINLTGLLSKHLIRNHNKNHPKAVELSLDSLINSRCLSQPESTAVEAHDGEFTYSEIYKLSSFLAVDLIEHGVKPNVFVPICFEKSCWTIIAILGVIKAGGAFVLLDPSFPSVRLKKICESIGATLIVSSKLMKDLASPLAKDVVIVSNESLTHASTDISRLEAIAQPSDALYAVFTSGSTGTPKGAVIEHRSFVTSSRAHGLVHGLNETSRVLQYTSYAWDVNIIENLSTLVHGGCLCIPSDSERREDYAEIITKYKPNWAFLTPSMARIVDPTKCSSLETLVIGGDAISSKELSVWSDHVKLFLIYGPTETAVFASTSQRVISKTHDGRFLGTFLGSNAWIVNPSNPNLLVPYGGIGELVITGPIVGRGYLNDATQTERAFISPPSWFDDFTPGKSNERLYMTGDLVRYHLDEIQFLCRKDHQVKIRGQRLELGEVDKEMMIAFSAISDFITTEIIRPVVGNPMLVAFMSIKEDRIKKSFDSIDQQHDILVDLTAEALSEIHVARRSLSSTLPFYMVPSLFLPLRFIPRTLQEKVDRRRLKELVVSLSDADVDKYSEFESTKQQPTTENERKLQEIWARVLNKPQQSISIYDSFFRVGGDSISAMQVASQCMAAGRGVTVANIFRYKTISQVAKVIDEVREVSYTPETFDVLFDLSPIQHLFFSLIREGCNHFNQDFILRCNREIKAEDMASAIEFVVSRHSMLRAKFKQEADDQWKQTIMSAAECHYQFEESVVASFSEMEVIARESQRHINITEGPILVSKLFRLGAETYLFITIHHLTVDLVSWRIILQDIEDFLTLGTTPTASSLPFQIWCQLQSDQMSKTVIDTQHTTSSMARFDNEPQEFWGVDFTLNTFADAVEQSFCLDPAVAMKLLGDANTTYQTQPVELFQAAIIHAFAETFHDRSVPAIWNEAHGREPWDSSIDISHTVGWFTTLWPLRVETQKNDLWGTVRRLKDTSRKIRKSGWEYFNSHYKDSVQREIIFNYVGQYQQLERADSLFSPITKSLQTDTVAGTMPRLGLIEISVYVQDGCLHFSFNTHKTAMINRPIEKWIAACRQCLIELSSVNAPDLVKYSLSDFPLVPFTYATMDDFVTNILPESGISIDEIEDVYPVAPIQRGLLFAQAKENSLYVNFILWRIRSTDGNLSCAHVSKSWSRVVERNSILRTAFVKSVVDDNFMDQVLLRKPVPEIRILPPDSESVLKENLFNSRALICSDGSLPHRFSIGQTTGGDIICGLEISHALFDGTTTQLLQDELLRACENEDHPSNTGSILSYKDYITYISSISGISNKAYWAAHLKNVVPCLLPTTNEGSSSVTLKEDLQFISVDVGPVDDIQGFCTRHQITMSNLFQVAWGLVLKSFTDSELVCFGYLNSGRDIPLAGIENAIGPFINLLVAFMQLPPNEPMIDVLLKSQAAHTEGIEHQHCSLTDVLRAANVSTSGKLFNTLMSLQVSRTVAAESQSSIVIEVVGGEQVKSEYDLTLNIVVEPSKIWTTMSYYPTRIEKSLMENVADAFRQAIQEIIRKPKSTVGEIELLGERGQEKLRAWNHADPPCCSQTIDLLLREQFLVRSSSVAVDSFDGSFTYRELDDLSTALCGYIRENYNVVPETFIPLIFEKSRWCVVALLAVIKTGAAFILLDSSYPVARLKEIINTSHASLVIFSESQAARGHDLGVDCVAIGESEQGWKCSSSVPFPSTISVTDALYAVFTSGSTGKPKGIVIEHQAFATSAKAQIQHMQISQESRVLQYSSYAFDVAIGDILVTLLAGGVVCIVSDDERKDLTILPAAVSRLNANWAYLTFTVARLLQPIDYPSIRKVFVGGEQVTAYDLRAWWQSSCELYFSYGPAEASVHCAISERVQPGTSGRNFGRAYGCRMWIVEQSNAEQLAPIGSVGELVIEGYNLARNYDERTAGTFLKNPIWLDKLGLKRSTIMYKTGDLVRYDSSNGDLLFMSRKDAQVKLSGQRLELGEVEHHLREQFEQSKDVMAAVVKFDESNRSPALVAFIVGQDGGETYPGSTIVLSPSSSFKARAASASAKLDQVLPLWMVPTIFIPIKQIPLTRTGKTDRRALMDIAAAMSSRDIHEFGGIQQKVIKAPRNAREEHFQQIFAKVFDVEVSQISLESGFFRLGGDSITAMRLIPVARDFSYGINIADIFNNPQVSDLAAAARSLHTSMDQETLTIAPFALVENPKPLITAAAASCNIAPTDIEDIYPASSLQEGLIALSLKQKGQYIVTFEYELSSKIELEAFKEAWNQTIKSNPILRTRLVSHESTIFQAVLRTSPNWDTFENRVAYQENHQELQVGMGTELVRLAIVKSGEDKGFKFYLTIHHSLYDSSSLAFLWSQVEQAYKKRPILLRPFNLFIKETRIPPRDAEVFWREQFKDLTASVYPAPKSSRFVPLPTASFSHAIVDLPRTSTRHTTSIRIRLAWAILMAAYTDSEEVVFGVTNNGRNAPIPGIEQISGPTIATFPLRVQVKPQDTVEKALTSIHERLTEIIPFQQSGLQNIRQYGKDASIACSFQTHLGIQAPFEIGTSSNLFSNVASEHDDYSAFANYALVIICHLPEKSKKSNEILVAVSYDNSLLDEADIIRMMHQFEAILRRVSDTTNEQRPLAKIDLISSQDNSDILRWMDTPKANEICLHDLVSDHARQNPSSPAICSWDGDMTRQELEIEADALSGYLRVLGVQPEQSVPICFERSRWTVVAMLAILKLGANCVCLDPGHPSERLKHIINRVGARIVLTSTSKYHLIDATGVEVISVPPENPYITQIHVPTPQISPNTIAFIVFTSGSTGTPKGVMLEHINLSTSIQSYSTEMKINHKSRCLHFASYAFDASIYEIFGSLTNGGCLCIPSEFDKMNDITLFLNEYKVNWIFFTPSAVSLLKPEDVPTVQTIVLGGEAVTQENVQIWAATKNLINGYGPAETTVCAVGRIFNENWKKGTIGKMSGGLGWITMPNDPTRLAPVGVTGELLIQGPVVSRGYIGDANTTDKSFIACPSWISEYQIASRWGRMYRSGDLFKYNHDGTLCYMGRRDTQIKLRGQRIELGEIEERLKQVLADDTELVVEIATPASSNSMIVAFIVKSATHEVKDGDLIEDLFLARQQSFSVKVARLSAQLRQKLPDYMIPSLYLQIDHVPRTNSNKLDRKKLRESVAALSRDQIRQFSEISAHVRKPITENERILQDLCSSVFDVPIEDISMDDDWFQLSGDSIMAMRLASLARQRGYRLDSSTIFRHPVLSELASFMETLPVAVNNLYQPGALMGITDLKAYRSNLLDTEHGQIFHSTDVEDVLPTTEFQQQLISSNNIIYSRLYMASKYETGRVTAACQALVRKYSVLRTSFLTHESGYIQVLLKVLDTEVKEYPCDGELLESSRELCQRDAATTIVTGMPVFKPFLLTKSNGHSLLILRMTHATYDGVVLSNIWKDFTIAYNGQCLSTPSLLFPKYMQYRQGQKNERIFAFWREYLQNAEPQSGLGHVTLSSFEAAVRIKSFKEFPVPMLPEGVTAATLTRAAWSLVISRRTARSDIIFGNIVNGRDVPLSGIEDTCGPTVTIAPFRAQINDSWTSKALLDYVQTQLTRTLPFSNVDFKDITQYATNWPCDTKFCSILTHQNVNDYPTHKVGDLDVTWDTLDFGVPVDRHMVTWVTNGKMCLYFTGSSDDIAQESADEIVENMFEAILLLVAPGNKPLMSV